MMEKRNLLILMTVLMFSLSMVSVGYSYWTDHLEVVGNADVRISIDIIDDIVEQEVVSPEALQLIDKFIPDPSKNEKSLSLIPIPVDPVSEPPQLEPASETSQTVPASEPTLTNPVSEPPQPEPASETPQPEPVSEPPQSGPVSEPPQSEPVSEPPQSEPVSEPPQSNSVSEPTQPEPEL